MTSSAVPTTGVTDVRTQLASSAPSVPITVHPLVLLNITDDASRIAANLKKGINTKDGFGDPNFKEGFERVPFGILLGTSGRETSAHTSVDFVALRDARTGAYSFNWEMAAKRVDLCRQVLASYDVVGWYATGTGIGAELATVVHEAFLKQKHNLESSNVCPKPIVVIMNIAPKAGSRGVPVVVFESRPVDQLAALAPNTTMLTRVEFTFESEETERIGVQQAADTSGTGTGNWVGPAADRFSGAVSSLNRRVNVITQYLQLVSEGKVANPDAELLRRIKQCATKLPRPEDALELRELLGEGVKDALTTTTVSLMTKGSLGFAQLLEDMNVGLEFENTRFK